MSTPGVTLDLSTYTPFDSGSAAGTPAASAGNLRQSISYGVQQDPDRHAMLLKQQQVTGMAPEAAAPLADDTQKAIDVEGLQPEQMATASPRTAGWAANPDNAAVAGADELHRLTRIEQHAATMRAYEPTWTDRIGDAAQSAFEFLGGQGSLKQKIFEYPVTRIGIDAVRGTEETAGNVGSFFGIHGDNGGPNRLQRMAQALTPESFGVQKTGLDTLAENVGPMIPALMMSGGTSLIARTLGLSDKAAKVLAGLGVGGMFTADQGGSTYNAMRAQGASDYDARLAANRVAAISAPANALFGATDVVPALRDNPFLTSLGLGGAIGTTGQLGQNIVTKQPWWKGLPMAAVQGAAVQGGMHLGLGFLDSMGETIAEIEQSKLRTRSPEKFQEAMQSQFEGDASVRIPAQDFVNYFAGKEIDPAEVANRLGVTNLEEASAAGSDLEIPKANFFAQLDPEHQKGLLPDVVDPSTDLTQRQSEAGRQELQDWVAGGGAEKLQQEFAQADAETQATPEWQQVYSDLKQRYVDAGETETAADGYATLQANAISNLAKGAGLSPTELLAMRNPNVVAGEPAGGMLFQSAPEGPELTDEEKQALAKIPSRGWKNSEDLLEYRSELQSLVDKGVIETRRNDEFGTDFRRINQTAEGGLTRRQQRNLDVARLQGEMVKGAQPEGGSAESASGPATEKRGWFRVLPNGRYEIGKTNIGDFSTFIHEPAHAYLEFYRDLAQRDSASPRLKEDFQKITEWLGTTPEEVSKNGFTREQHEQWARANEEYIREGKAPTSGLQRAFHNFAQWLQTIYKRAGELGVQLSPEIREVMDRLYAGDSAVDRAEQEAGKQQIFENPEEAGFTEGEYKNYAEAHGVEEAEARRLVRNEMKDAAVRERTEAWREEYHGVREATEQQINERPEYRAIRALRKGALNDVTPLTLNRDALVSQFGEDRVKALNQLHRGLYRNEGGTDADTAAELLGFRSGEEMMRSLENAPRRKDAIDAATRATMTARHGDIRYDGSLEDKARLAVENSQRSNNLYRELKALRAKVESLKQKSADAKAAMAAITIEPLEHYQEAARQMIDQKAIADIQPHRYLNASRKYSREAFDALRKGSVKRAADAKNKELLNHFLFREASAARDYAEKFEKYTQRVQSKGIQQRLGIADQNAKQAGYVGDYREQFNWLLARYGLGAPMDQPDRSLRDWADEMFDQGKEPAIAASILNEGRFADWRSVPLSEIRDLHDSLVNVRHLALKEFQMYVQGKQVRFAEAKQEMIAAARENLKIKPEQVFEENRSAVDRKADALRYGDALLMRMERFVEWLDGGKSGPWHDNLWNLASDAQGDEYGLQHGVTKVVTDALADMPPEMRRRLWTEKVSVEGIPDPLTRRQMLSMAFNMGNEGNLDRLRKTFDTFEWDRDAIGKIGGMLTHEEWNFVQKTWDSLKPLGERMQELEQRLTGLPPQMVKVKPFKVALDDGTEMDMAGGYFPIVMDPRYSQRAIEQDAKETAQNAMQSGYVRATTAKGYTKERSGFGGPLLLDYERAMTSHVAKVTKDLSHREFMLASQRFLLDTDVRKTLRETLGPAYEEQFMPWLRTIINDRNGSVDQGLGKVSRLMQQSRANIVAASIGFKVSTLMLQITHAPRMLLYARPASVAQALVDFLARPVEMTREIRELSPNEMRFRGDNLDRDIRAALQKPDYQGGYSRKAATAARWTLQAVDHLFSHTLWRAAYKDALVKYDGLAPEDAQKKAIYEADSAVRLGLNSQAPKDLPAIMRNNDFNKMITTLYGFHNGVYNQLRDIGHQFRYDRNVGKLTYATVLTAMLPAVLGSYVTGDRPKDGENPGAWSAKRALLFAADTIPLVGSVAEFMERGRDMQFTPIESVLEKGSKAALDAISDKEDKDWLGIGLNAAEAAGELGGAPGSRQVIQSARYVRRAQQGKVENPNVWSAIVGGGR